MFVPAETYFLNPLQNARANGSGTMDGVETANLKSGIINADVNGIILNQNTNVFKQYACVILVMIVGSNAAASETLLVGPIGVRCLCIK